MFRGLLLVLSKTNCNTGRFLDLYRVGVDRFYELFKSVIRFYLPATTREIFRKFKNELIPSLLFDNFHYVIRLSVTNNNSDISLIPEQEVLLSLNGI